MPSRDTSSLVVFYLGAFAAPLIAGRARVPAALVEILFGLLLGPAGLGLLHRTPFSDFLAHLGFTFLMFLVGMEIDFNHVRREGRRALALAAGVAVLVLGLAGLAAWGLGLPGFFALVFGAMSVGILLVSLIDSGLQRSRFGQTLLLVGSIGETLTLLALTSFSLVHRFGVGLQLILEIGKVLLLFWVAYVVLAVLRLLVWWAPVHFQRLVRASDPSEIGVRAGFVLMLTMAALSSLAGLEPILGAFLAGGLFSFVLRDKGPLEAKLSAIGQGFFVPLFFIDVGVTFPAGALRDPWTILKTVLVLGGVSLLVKVAASLLLIGTGLRPRQALAGGLLLATPLTLLVAVAEVGERLHILDAPTHSAVILLALTSGLLFPIGFRMLTHGATDAAARRGAQGTIWPPLITRP